MNFSLALIAAFAASTSTTDAFTANLNSKNFKTSLMAARIDSSDLVAEAMKVTEKFGATSAEARLAWEAVEEVDASDNSVASMRSLTDECEVDVPVVSPECVEYGEALDELQELIASPRAVSEAAAVEPVKLSGSQGIAGPQSKELEIALEEARAITAEKGLSSPQAAVAWEIVEEIAASGNANAMGAVQTRNDALDELKKHM